MRLKQLTLKDIETRKKYLRLIVTLKGKMSLVPLKFYKTEPILEQGIRFIQVGPIENPMSLEELGVNYQGVEDLGLDPNKHTNFHRTFASTPENKKLLKDLVDRQALLEYLIIIGIPKAGEEAQKLLTTTDEELERRFKEFWLES